MARDSTASYKNNTPSLTIKTTTNAEGNSSYQPVKQ